MARSFIQSLPKAELHLHLEGSVDPATLVELSRRYNTPLPTENNRYDVAGSGDVLTDEDVRRLYSYKDFNGFLLAFKSVTERLRSPEDYELVTYRLMQKLRQQNIVHAEVYVSVGVIRWRGQPVELKPKQVEVKELDIFACDGNSVRFKAWVSSGTYLRSLAHDLGKKLGPGAHLAELKRTAVREFTIEEAHSLEELEQARAGNTLDELFLHPRLVLPEFPAVVASPESAARIRHGSAVNLPEFSKAGTVRVFAGQRELLAIARRVAGTLFQPKVVLQG